MTTPGSLPCSCCGCRATTTLPFPQQEVALREATNAFTTKQHDDERIVVCVDGAANWIGEMCHTAHGDMWPDDFRYRVIRDAIEAIAETDEDADLDDLADGRVISY